MLPVRFPFPPDFFLEVSSALDELQNFGVDPLPMWQVVEGVRDDVFASVQEATLAMSDLEGKMGEISLKYGVDIKYSHIPYVMKQALQTLKEMYPGPYRSETLSPLQRSASISPKYGERASSSSSACSTVHTSPLASQTPFFSVEQLQESDIFQPETLDDDLLDLEETIALCSEDVERLRSSRDLANGGGSREVLRRIEEILYHHGECCLHDLKALQESIVPQGMSEKNPDIKRTEVSEDVAPSLQNLVILEDDGQKVDSVISSISRQLVCREDDVERLDSAISTISREMEVITSSLGQEKASDLSQLTAEVFNYNWENCLRELQALRDVLKKKPC